MSNPKKFYITDEDRKRAAALTREIGKAQCELLDLIREAHSSRAYASLGVPTWRKYAEMTLNSELFRISAVTTMLLNGTSNTDSLAERRPLSPQMKLVLQYINEHQGCTGHDLQRGLQMASPWGRVAELTQAGLVRHGEKIDGRSTLWPVESDAT